MTDAPSASKPAASRWATVVKWIGGVTAILSLIFGLRQLVGIITSNRERNQQIEQRLQVQTVQRAGGDFAAAWATLLEAAKIDPGRKEVQNAREDLAMEWLRRIRVREGEQTFADIVQQVQPVLMQGIVAADGGRKGDLLAHVGWSEFLRDRYRQDAQPESYYRQALDADAQNPYAHAMWGHWTLWRSRPFAEAQTHFEHALTSGREKEYVRSLQIAALMNESDSLSDRVLLRVANELRTAGDTLDADSRRRIIDRNCSAYSGFSKPVTSAASAPGAELSADAALSTLRWLSNDLELADFKQKSRDYCVANLHEAAGRPDSALVAYTTLRDQLPSSNTLRTLSEAAIKRLSRRPAR